MMPSLYKGQIIIAIHTSNIKIHEIVVINVGGKEIIKRVSLMSPKEVFVLGDNQNRSTDSREFGWVSKNQIIGKVVWPINKNTSY